MENAMIVQGGGATGPLADAPLPRARRFGRCRMFKPAQLSFNGAVLDCVLLDASPGGVQVHLMAPAEVPEVVTLRLPGGASPMARRCWRNGSHIGFEFVGTCPPEAVDGLLGAGAAVEA